MAGAAAVAHILTAVTAAVRSNGDVDGSAHDDGGDHRSQLEAIDNCKAVLVASSLLFVRAMRV